VFSVRYGLDLCILFRRYSVFKGLSRTRRNDMFVGKGRRRSKRISGSNMNNIKHIGLLQSRFPSAERIGKLMAPSTPIGRPGKPEETK
jgi:hypothetical protein